MLWFSVAWSETPTILVLGDSLSASYGVELSKGWVSLLERRLAEKKLPYRVVNASISGDVSRGGLSRLTAALERYRPAIVILELGGNDGLQGLPLRQLEENLAGMIELSRKAGAQVVLAGMRIPPNYGPRYSQGFHEVFETLAKRYDIPLIPFLLEGVGGHPELMQADGVHPRAEAQPKILENAWVVLEPLLQGGRAGQ
ncbi:MAG TPA: arylesterase [Candidatus Competibacteraceae bacterium]|nr:arylesterase [Candidatus Competibacteraceae bacterium]